METARHDSIDFFLGATTPAGFKGYFEPLRHEPGMQMYLIKSGPGCGKSTFMKRIASVFAERCAGMQLIPCSSDPESLDASSCRSGRFPSSTAPPRMCWSPRTPPFPKASSRSAIFWIR